MTTMLLVAPAAFAQAANGNGECADKVEISYYKIVPGHQDEWLTLYQKWHARIMQYERAHGMVLSSKLYESGSYSFGMPWDFAIINIYPWRAVKASLSRAELIRKLYPDLQSYVAAEKRRWALTVSEWDDVLVQMNTDEPLSVYEPVDGFCKR
jgi:hypothetical protein